MTKSLFKIGAMLLTVCVCVVLGMSAMTLAYSLPTYNMAYTVQESLETIVIEEQDSVIYEGFESTIDSFTDGIMLNSAQYKPEASAFEEAVRINALHARGAGGRQTLWMQYHGLCNETEVVSYARYWHGYMVFLKPLLMFFNYMEIRSVCLVVQTALVLLCLFLVVKKGLKSYLPAFVVLFLLQDVYLSSRCLQFGPIFYVYTAGLIVILLFYEKFSERALLPIVFVLLGAASSFLDLLTYPIATYGIPLVLCLVLDKCSDWWKKLKDVVLLGLSWILGYAGMWGGKAAIGYAVMGDELIADMHRAVLHRASEEGGAIQYRLTGIKYNLVDFSETLMFPVFVLLCIVLLVLLLYRSTRGKCTVCRADLLEILPFALVCLSPICWYFVLAEHSVIHSYFTHKAMFVPAFSLMCLLLSLNAKAKNGIKNS